MRHETRDDNGDARPKDLSSHDSYLSPSDLASSRLSSSNRPISRLLSPVSRPLTLTLKAWPVIAAATIGLCFLTQWGAGLFGLALPEQTNIEIVKRCFANAFTSWKAFDIAAFLAAQVLVLMPVIEEAVFRLPTRWLRHRAWWFAFSALFSAAHYLAQPWPDNAFLALFFFGLAQCWLYRKTQRLWCAMTNHFLFNLTNLLLLFLV